VKPMHERIPAVIKARDGPTKYYMSPRNEMIWYCGVIVGVK